MECTLTASTFSFITSSFLLLLESVHLSNYNVNNHITQVFANNNSNNLSRLEKLGKMFALYFPLVYIVTKSITDLLF